MPRDFDLCFSPNLQLAQENHVPPIKLEQDN